MMEKDDEAARKARTESLMGEISRLTSRSPSDEKKPRPSEEEPSGENEKTRPESPREFIHRRMRELDEQKNREGKK